MANQPNAGIPVFPLRYFDSSSNSEISIEPSSYRSEGNDSEESNSIPSLYSSTHLRIFENVDDEN